jgi:hypothetical protein
MRRTGRSRLELRFVGQGPRGQVERDDGAVADFDGWTDLGRAIHELGGLEEIRPEDDPQDVHEGDPS